ncbi:hypothetical protein [Halorarius litoreus]|uniref:hypothetical protein n=1 Tax=Halorarius litoreus TaxID=2962676 RepID=UPI0020CD9527|nr:hypothetical protein [Halorarius litoreus]
MFDRLVAFDRKLTEQQKITAGVAGILLGVALIGALAFAGISSLPMQVAVAFLGVMTMVTGTLMLGTSEQGEQTV